jgi:plasmid maintenance system antidote protein VapI
MKETLSDVLRRAILESGMTRYAIAVKAGVDQAALSRFVSGKRSMSLETADKLMDALDLEVRPRKRKDS